MACLDMYNNNSSSSNTTNTTSQPLQSPPLISPRISFSNDFVDSHHHSLLNSTNRPEIRQAPSSDFEFSVTDLNMMSAADELFFKGRLLPFTGSLNHIANPTQMQRTLRDELLDDDDDDNNDNNIDLSRKPPKASSSSSSNRWKNLLGLRKSHIGSKKPDFNVNTFAFAPPSAKSPQDVVSNEGSSSTDMEMGV